MSALVAFYRPDDQQRVEEDVNNGYAPQKASSTPQQWPDDAGTSVGAAMDRALAEDSDDEELKQSSSSSILTSSTLGGLENLGNTCYMASSVQMLASLDGFATALQAQAPVRDDALREQLLKVTQQLAKGRTVRPDDLKAAIDQRSLLFVGYAQEDAHEFLTTLVDLLDEDYQQNAGAESKQEPVSARDDEAMPAVESSPKKPRIDVGPSWMVPSLHQSRSLCDLNVEEIGQLLYSTPATPDLGLVIPTPQAESTHCKLLGGRMYSGDATLTKFNTKTITEEQPVSAHESRTSHNDAQVTSTMADSTSSPVRDIFSTQVRVRLICDSCCYSRCHTETFFHLSLEISENDASVEEGLRKFFAPEKRELKCEKCFYTSATQTTEILRLPQALLLHLKRFVVGDDDTFFAYTKNRAPVAFDDRMDDSVLSEFTATACNSQDAVYDIRSIVHHKGSSATFGHYTTDAHRLIRGSRSWYRFNDEYVTEINADEAMSGRETAYMILYERRQDEAVIP